MVPAVVPGGIITEPAAAVSDPELLVYIAVFCNKFSNVFVISPVSLTIFR